MAEPTHYSVRGYYAARDGTEIEFSGEVIIHDELAVSGDITDLFGVRREITGAATQHFLDGTERVDMIFYAPERPESNLLYKFWKLEESFEGTYQGSLHREILLTGSNFESSKSFLYDVELTLTKK